MDNIEHGHNLWRYDLGALTTHIINVKPLDIFKDSANVTLHVVIDKISMKHLSKGEDRFYLGSTLIDVETNYIEKTYAPPGFRSVNLFRKNVKSEDVRKQDIEKMPGFRFSWFYSELDVEKIPLYSNDDMTKNFVRNY